MATIRELGDKALEDFAKSLSMPRNGIVLTRAGIRVGTWRSTGKSFMLQADDPTFKKVVDELAKFGLYTFSQFVVPKDEETEDLVDIHGTQHIPLNEAPVGVVDMSLKKKGYLLIDLSDTAI